jgi:hypothetical protein
MKTEEHAMTYVRNCDQELVMSRSYRRPFAGCPILFTVPS